MNTLYEWLGVELDEVSWKEKFVSVLGGAVSIAVVMLVCHHALGLVGSPMLIASMGASAVLLFAVPHGQLSQPWPVVAGHVASAAIGVACARWIPNVELAAGCAVGLAIGAMHQFKFIHPPGGATALTAVIGGTAVTSRGFAFVWEPVLLNAVLMVAIAVVFNAVFAWRRYPSRFAADRARKIAPEDADHAHILTALRSMDSFIDITEDDLRRLVHVLRNIDSRDEQPSTGA
jgi:CBS-domain-containing membrane protein